MHLLCGHIVCEHISCVNTCIFVVAGTRQERRAPFWYVIQKRPPKFSIFQSFSLWLTAISHHYKYWSFFQRQAPIPILSSPILPCIWPATFSKCKQAFAVSVRSIDSPPGSEGIKVISHLTASTAGTHAQKPCRLAKGLSQKSILPTRAGVLWTGGDEAQRRNLPAESAARPAGGSQVRS